MLIFANKLIVLYNPSFMRIIAFIRLFIVFIIISFLSYSGNLIPLRQAHGEVSVLSKRTMSLYDRYGNRSVNDVFRDNILLTLGYMSGQVDQAANINWPKLKKPFSFDYVLSPGQVFAFHDDVLDSFKNNKVTSTHAHFDEQEGFLSDGYLYGDGVCHLASLINWAAIDAGLYVLAPSRHDFAVIPGIPEKYGVSIYVSPDKGTSEQQNLYIKNTFDKPVLFAFNYNKDILSLTITKQN